MGQVPDLPSGVSLRPALWGRSPTCRLLRLAASSEPFPRSSRGILDDGQVYVTDKETWDEPITLHWKDAKRLVIWGPFGTRETHWQDVSISYE